MRSLSKSSLVTSGSLETDDKVLIPSPNGQVFPVNDESVRVPAGCGGARQAAGSGFSCLGAEGVGADGGYGPSHQAPPGGDVDVHLWRSQEGFT